MDQELNTVEVSGPHRNMKRAALQLDAVEQAESGGGVMMQVEENRCYCGALT